MSEEALAWGQVTDSLGELAGLLLGAEPPDAVLHRVAALATRMISAAASCSVSVPRGEAVETVAAANDLSRQLDEMQYANGDGPCLQAMRDGTAVYTADLARESRWGEYPQLAVGHGVLSMLSLPLAPQGKTIGGLNLYATVPDAFAARPVRALCELFAGQAGVTLAGAQRHAAQLELTGGLSSELERLLERDRARAARSADQQRRLAGLIEVLAGPVTQEQVGQAAVDTAADGTGAAAAALLQHHQPEAGEELLELLAERNLPEPARERFAGLPLGEAGALVGPSGRAGGPVVLPAQDLPETDPHLAGLLPDRTVAVVPLGQGSASAGLLVLAYPPGGEPDPDGLGYLLTVTRLATAALDRVRLAAAETAAAARLALLAQASAALVGSVARNRALPVLTSMLVPELADWAVAHQLQPDGRLRLVDTRSADPHRRGLLTAALTDLAPSLTDPVGVGPVAAQQRPACYPHITPDVLKALVPDPDRLARVAALDLTAVLILPLVAAGVTLGTITLARSGRGFDPADIALAQQIAGRAAVTLDNSRLYAQAADAALTLQRSLLPAELPDTPGLTTAARYLPGTAGLEAGGDFYDVIPLPGGRVGLAIGDVMGHGIAAAAVMGQLRAALRAYALEGHEPAALLTRLNTVVDALGGGELTTCTYAVYTPTSRQLRIGTAGHLPPLLSGPGQPTRYLELDPGLPLGVGAADFAEITLTLPAGTTMLLYTDGLVETRTAPLTDGLHRLAAAVPVDALPPDELCEHLLRVLGPHDPDQPAEDDTALLAAATRS